MGVREDQLVGYFGADVSTWSNICHAGLCMGAHFEHMESINQPGERYKVDMDKLNALSPDIIVDAAYCHQPEDCYKNATTYKGLLAYVQAEATQPLMESTKWKVINIQVAARAYIDVVGSFQNLAIAVGDPPNPDTVEHCHTFHAAMTAMHQGARRMWAEGIRVTTVAMAEEYIYAAQPTDDPILTMLEQLGVPMVHVNVNDPRGGYWEWIDFNQSKTGWQAQTLLADGSGPIYDTDIWLYDSRSHEATMGADGHGDNFDHPAWQAGQVAPWPIDSTWSYEYGTRILNQLRAVFDKSTRIMEKTTCTIHTAGAGVANKLAPGQWACHCADNCPSLFPECPTASASTASASASPPPPGLKTGASEANPDSKDDSISTGAAAGIGVGCAVAGLLIGAIGMKLCAKGATTPKFTTGAGKAQSSPRTDQAC